MSVLHAEGISKMNPGLFGILGSSLGSSNSKVRLRKPFSRDEQNKAGIRLSNLNQHACLYGGVIDAALVLRSYASDSQGTVVTVGHTGTVAAPTGTTSAYTSPDGETWTLRTMLVSGAYKSVVWAGDRFIAVSTTTACQHMVSPFTTWTTGTALPASDLPLIMFNGKLYGFPTAGTTYYEFTTTAAAANTTRTSPANYIAPANGVTVACGALVEASGTSIRYSYDGVAWNVGTSPGFSVVSLMGNSSTLFAFDASGKYNVSNTAGLTWLYPSPVIFDITSLGMYSTLSGAGFGADNNGPLGTFASSIASVTPMGNLGERIGVSCKVANTNGASPFYNYVLVHTIDGKSWNVEHPYLGQSTSADPDFRVAGTAHIDRFVLGNYRQASLSSAVVITNPDFMELCYDL